MEIKLRFFSVGSYKSFPFRTNPSGTLPWHHLLIRQMATYNYYTQKSNLSRDETMRGSHPVRRQYIALFDGKGKLWRLAAASVRADSVVFAVVAGLPRISGHRPRR